MAATDRPAEGARSDHVLRTENLTKRFGELVAVDGVDLAVERGEFRSIIGPNGAGKTTTFNLISGAMRPSEGRVFFDGTDVTAMPVHERVRRGMARSFQISNVFGGLTVRENVRLAAQSVFDGGFRAHESLFRPTGRFEEVNAVADDVLRRIDLDAQADLTARTLAYGDRRRLEIGLVLATDPELVLLDEPTAGMSREETRDTIALIEDVLAEKALILVEHDIELVMNVSDRITVLHYGSVLAEGTPGEIAGDERVQEAYLGGFGE